jgi:hypothetical protein
MADITGKFQGTYRVSILGFLNHERYLRTLGVPFGRDVGSNAVVAVLDPAVARAAELHVGHREESVEDGTSRYVDGTCKGCPG